MNTSEKPAAGSVEDVPKGARYFKCALHVNPFGYLTRQGGACAFGDEAAFNSAMVDACLSADVEVIAVPDHYRIRSAVSLMTTAASAGLIVLPGFEAVSRDGVHFLCLFDPGTAIDKIDRIIGECGVHDLDATSPQGGFYAEGCLERAVAWGCTMIAAHVCSSGGLLATLKGTARARVWRAPGLQACSLPGAVSDCPQEYRGILTNREREYRRERPIAVINAQDVTEPKDASRTGGICWIKMSSVSIEGLRQAFLEPDSRIRLPSDPAPEDHTELVGITWDGGFLDGQAIHFNENLNVLIGGRGTGKSTVVESIRHVLSLEPLGNEAKENHEGIVRRVLKSGTRTRLVVRSHRPTRREYVVERVTPHPPVVLDSDNNRLDLRPEDVLPGLEVYGQHEIAELTRNPELLTRLLGRFLDLDPSLPETKAELKLDLERNRAEILAASRDLDGVDAKLAKLPALEEKASRFKEAGLEGRLAENSALIREEGVLKVANRRIEDLARAVQKTRGALPVDRGFCAEDEISDLPAAALLREVDGLLQKVSDQVQDSADTMESSLAEAQVALVDVIKRWDMRKQAASEKYSQVLRELQDEGIDGDEFVRVGTQIENLKPEKDRRTALKRRLSASKKARQTLVSQWSEIQGEEHRRLTRAASRVSKALKGKVRVQVRFAGNITPLKDLLREQLGGRLSEALEALENKEDLSAIDLGSAVRTGADQLELHYGIPANQAIRMHNAGEELALMLEELELPATTQLELNVAAEGQPDSWQVLENLSTGQKATAVLLLLLLESDYPLVVDQPEDDLDNRFISEGIVPKMHEEKRRRQFIFATHNANIPVLGDAELILGLRASGEADLGHGEVPIEHMGSIDTAPVRELVEEVLEGGKDAFRTRCRRPSNSPS